jgi:hypothetical protein
VTLTRYKALKAEWRRVPPAALSLAALIQYKPPPDKSVPADDELVPGEQLAAMFPDGHVRMPGNG